MQSCEFFRGKKKSYSSTGGVRILNAIAQSTRDLLETSLLIQAYITVKNPGTSNTKLLRQQHAQAKENGECKAFSMRCRACV